MKKIMLLSLCYMFTVFSILAVDTFKIGHFDAINDIVKYPFGNISLTVGNDEVLHAIDINNDKIVKTFEVNKGALTCVAASPNGQNIAIGTKSGSIYIYDYDTGKRTDSQRLHTGKVTSVLFSGDTMVSSGLDGNIFVYDAASKSLLKSLAMPSKIISMEISPDKSVIAAGDDQGNVYLISTADFSNSGSYKAHSNWVSGISFSPDSKTIAACSWDLTVSFYYLPSSGISRKISIDTEKALNSITWSSDNKYISVSSSDSKIYIITSLALGPVFTLEGHKKPVYRTIFFPDSRKLISVSGDSSMKVWNLENPDEAVLEKSYSSF